MSLTQLYTRADVLRWLGSKEVQKGIVYLDAVSQIKILPDSLTSQVLGTARQPYRQHISFFGIMQEYWIWTALAAVLWVMVANILPPY